MRERLRRFNEDRTRMMAAMSHDLRTPLTRLRMRIEMAQGLEDQQKMLDELDMMNGMVESILSFTRDDAKQEARSLVDLSALVEGICEDAVDAGEKVTFSGPRDVTISCRPTAMRRAISNLVDNAVKYGGKADVTLAPEAGRVVITVEDEGPGIPRSEREKVFEPFYRIGSARDPSTGGVGLGLSVTRSIIWEHGGDITLGNRKGGGLSVRVELPSEHPSGRRRCSHRPLGPVRAVSSGRRNNAHPHGHGPRGALRTFTSPSFQRRPGSDGCLLCSSRRSSPQHFGSVLTRC